MTKNYHGYHKTNGILLELVQITKLNLLNGCFYCNPCLPVIPPVFDRYVLGGPPSYLTFGVWKPSKSASPIAMLLDPYQLNQL